jgi:hypothetical protein
LEVSGSVNDMDVDLSLDFTGSAGTIGGAVDLPGGLETTVR